MRVKRYRGERLPRMAALGMSVVLAVGLVTGVSSAQAASQTTRTLPVAVPTPAPLSWQPCVDQPERDCAWLSVPLDYAHPGGAQTMLPVARARATDTANRVGPLFFNLGGPGIPSTGTVKFADLGLRFTPEVAAKFDIIGFDPRGTSGGGITCLLAGPRETYWETNRLARTTAQLDTILTQERHANQGCIAHSSPLSRHVDTASTVRDMEMLRKALGVTQFSYVGMSYGTFIGTRYQQLYPDRIRAMVLDAVVDRSVSDLQAFVESNAAFDRGWSDFKAWCQATPTCRLRGQNIDAVTNAVLATARTTPIPAPYSPTSQRPVNDWILTVMLQAAVSPGDITFGWVEEMIVKAQSGDASLARLIYDSSTGFPGAYFEGGDQHRAIVCEDTRWSQLLHSPASVGALAAASRLSAPRFGEANVFAGPVQCADFPVAAVEPPPIAPGPVAGQPASLLIGATQDVSTPLVWAQRVKAQQPAGSKLLTRNGPGHVSLDKSRCVKDAVSNYLVRQSLGGPATCPTDADLYPPQDVPILGPSLAARGGAPTQAAKHFLSLSRR